MDKVRPDQSLEVRKVLDPLDFATERSEVGKELGKVAGDTRQSSDGHRITVQSELAFDQLQQHSCSFVDVRWRDRSTAKDKGAGLLKNPRVAGWSEKVSGTNGVVHGVLRYFRRHAQRVSARLRHLGAGGRLEGCVSFLQLGEFHGTCREWEVDRVMARANWKAGAKWTVDPEVLPSRGSAGG